MKRAKKARLGLNRSLNPVFEPVHGLGLDQFLDAFLFVGELGGSGLELAEHDFVVREDQAVDGRADETELLWRIGKVLGEGNPLLGQLPVLHGMAGLAERQLGELGLELHELRVEEGQGYEEEQDERDEDQREIHSSHLTGLRNTWFRRRLGRRTRTWRPFP